LWFSYLGFGRSKNCDPNFVGFQIKCRILKKYQMLMWCLISRIIN
jgi:hypothetical protein